MAKKKHVNPSEVRRSCLALRMRLASRVITKIYDDALRPYGLRSPQLAMLALAAERGVLRQADICRELQLDDSTLSRNLERMQSRGWLEEAVGEDAREHPYTLSTKGRELLEKAMPAWKTAQQKADDLLGAHGVNALNSFASQHGLV